MTQSVFWTVDDALAGACSMADVGSRKPELAASVGDAPSDEGGSVSEQLKRDALSAYKALGGADYLKRNPELLDKALLKLIAEPEKKSETSITIKIDAPWMSPNRLSYQREVIDMVPASVERRAEQEAKQLDDAAARHALRPERQPEALPLLRAADVLKPDPRTVGNPSGPNATPKRSG